MALNVESQRDGSVRSHTGYITKSDSMNRTPRLGEDIIKLFLLACGLLSILTTIGIIYVLGTEASKFFFDSRAWLIAKVPIADEASSSQLGETIDLGETVFTLTFDGERVPYSDNQHIQIGDEIMQVISRGRTTIEVTRGQLGTVAVEHPLNAEVFGMTEKSVRPLIAVSETDTVIKVEPGYASAIDIGDEIQMEQEYMFVTGINDDLSEITVERGAEDTTIKSHSETTNIMVPRYPSFLEFLTSTEWNPRIGQFGIWPLLNATLLISFIALLVSIPLGLGAAIFLSEYATPGVRNTLKPILEILAGIPTVVFGFFALTLVTPILQGIFGEIVQFYNILSAGLVVGILLIPLISSLSEDALSAVPMALREASYGLGATKLETTIKVVLPAAVSGIMAAIILAISRAVGETMVVAMAAGSGPNFTFNIFEGAETMTGHIVRISGGDLTYNSIDYTSIYALGAALFVLTLLLNLISGYIRDRLREEY